MSVNLLGIFLFTENNFTSSIQNEFSASNLYTRICFSLSLSLSLSLHLIMNEGGGSVESSRGSPSPPILPDKAMRKSKTWYWVSAFHAPAANE
jgi:hypothetical protein